MILYLFICEIYFEFLGVSPHNGKMNTFLLK